MQTLQVLALCSEKGTDSTPFTATLPAPGGLGGTWTGGLCPSHNAGSKLASALRINTRQLRTRLSVTFS